MKILVTGGAGYIGSHTVIALMEAGHDVVIVDNFSNSKRAVLDRIRELTGHSPTCHRVDLLDVDALKTVLDGGAFEAVVHFAGLKAVGESTKRPRIYYENNVVGTLNLLSAMEQANVRTLVFSSSATVYGDPHQVPIHESFPLAATNPYGRSKLMIEDILRDVSLSDERWTVCLLRYFNPVGAHQSGRLGEDPRGIPNNLAPFIAQVAVGKRTHLDVFGDDYPTPDGTGVRDYIHVLDLAAGHLAALHVHHGDPGVHTYNLGTGRGYSVLEVLAAFENAIGNKIPYRIAPRRPGDIAQCFADASRAREKLGWSTRYTLTDMTRDVWRWQQTHPDGLPEPSTHRPK